MSNPRILIIEDDDAIRRMIATSLTAKGHEIHTAADGIAGLDAALSLKPDVIVLDVTMPRMDGWQVIARLRETPEFAFTPVIMLTALASPDHRVEGFRLGADDYITKPFRPAELELRIARALKQRAQLVYFTNGLNRARVSGSTPAMRGTLRDFNAASVLSMLFDERKTGVVTFIAEGAEAHVQLRAGMLVATEINGRVGSPADACQMLAALADGTFEFDATAPIGDGPGDPSTTEIIASMRSPIEVDPIESVPPPR